MAKHIRTDDPATSITELCMADAMQTISELEAQNDRLEGQNALQAAKIKRMTTLVSTVSSQARVDVAEAHEAVRAVHTQLSNLRDLLRDKQAANVA